MNKDDDYPDDYDPCHEEEIKILASRRSALKSILPLNNIDDYLAKNLEEQENIIRDILNEDYENILTTFADHFLPTDSARYTIDDDVPPKIDSVELESAKSGFAYISGTCSMHSLCRDSSDIGRDFDGAIKVLVNIRKSIIVVSIDEIPIRTTLGEF